MNTQHPEPENDLEAEAKRRALDYAATPEQQEVTGSTQLAESHSTSPANPSEADPFGFRHSGFRRSRQTSAMLSEAEALSQTNHDHVLRILREESRKRAKKKRLYIGIFVGLMTLFILIAIFAHDKTLLHGMGGWVSLITMGAAASSQHKSAALALTKLGDDMRAVGPLAEVLDFQDKDKSIVNSAALKLTKLLPQMKASDSALLSPEQRQCLNKALRGKNIDLILAILKAYEQVGDTGAIPEVEKLAAGRGHGGRYPWVVKAAQECLPALRQSAERQIAGAQLLRASDAGPVSPGTLLRPAMPHTSNDPADQLLRPTDTNA